MSTGAPYAYTVTCRVLPITAEPPEASPHRPHPALPLGSLAASPTPTGSSPQGEPTHSPRPHFPERCPFLPRHPATETRMAHTKCHRHIPQTPSLCQRGLRTANRLLPNLLGVPATAACPIAHQAAAQLTKPANSLFHRTPSFGGPTMQRKPPRFQTGRGEILPFCSIPRCSPN